MKSGVGAFNKKASEVYGALSKTEKDRLTHLAAVSTSEETTISPREAYKAGAKAFKVIQKQVQ